MQPNPINLLRISGIKTPLIGFYDIADPKPFEPFSKPKRCYFSCYENWLMGDSICISAGEASCQGGGYWVGDVMPAWAVKSAGTDGDPLESFAKSLNHREGFKSSDELMCQWFENQQPYLIENEYVSEKWWLSYPDHISYFNKETMCNVLADLGFVVHSIVADNPIDLNLLNDNSNYIKDNTLYCW